MVVEQQLATNRVAVKLKIPYTTLTGWVKKYPTGGQLSVAVSAFEISLALHLWLRLINDAHLRRFFSGQGEDLVHR